MGYFKKELKTYVLANRKLKKTAVETENFLVDICGRNEIEQKRKDSTIKNLKNEIEAKSALIKVCFTLFIILSLTDRYIFMHQRKQLLIGNFSIF